MHDKKKKQDLVPEDEVKTNKQKERVKKAFLILQDLFNKKSQCDLYGKLLSLKDISPDILLQNEDFFSNSDFNESSALVITGELLSIYPEFTPIWNYRRFLLLSKFFFIRKNVKVTTFVYSPMYGDIDESLSLLVEELSLIQQIFRHTCKSYGIWYHRWYIVYALCRWLTTWDHKVTLFRNELDLVDSLFVKDDRNFYCWNYRQLLLNLLLETSKSSPSIEQPIFSILSSSSFESFLKQHVTNIQCIPNQQIVSYYQLYTSFKMINRNINNYSAWHLRIKYFTESLTQSDQEIQEELFFIETAFYTDPNDSSVWNYYKFYVLLKASQMTLDYADLIHVWPNLIQTSSSTWKLKNICLLFSKPTLIRNVSPCDKEESVQWYPYSPKLVPRQSQHKNKKTQASLNIFPVFQDIQRKENPFETFGVSASMCWIGVMKSPRNSLEKVVTLPVCIENKESLVESYYLHLQKNSGSGTESVTWSLNSFKVVPNLNQFSSLQNAMKDSRIKQWTFLCDEIQRCNNLLDIDSTFYKYPLMIKYWIFEELHKLFYRLPFNIISSWCEKNLYCITSTDNSKQHNYLSQLQTELLTKVSQHDSIRQKLYDHFIQRLFLWSVTFTVFHREATIDFNTFSSFDPKLLTLLNPGIQKYKIETSPTSTELFNKVSFFLSCETQEIDLSSSNCSNLSQLLLSLPYCEALPSLKVLNLTGSLLSDFLQVSSNSKNPSKESLNKPVILRLVHNFPFPLPETIFITNTPLAQTCQHLSQEERQTIFFPYTDPFCTFKYFLLQICEQGATFTKTYLDRL